MHTAFIKLTEYNYLRYKPLLLCQQWEWVMALMPAKGAGASVGAGWVCVPQVHLLGN